MDFVVFMKGNKYEKEDPEYHGRESEDEFFQGNYLM
jgi:hypothetical protein